MSANGIYKEVGLHIRARRRRLRLTLEQLAALSNVSASYIGQIERDVKKTSLKTLGVLAEALGVRVSTLFDPAGPLAELPLGKRIETILRAHTPRERRLLSSSLRHLSKGLQLLRAPSQDRNVASAAAPRKRPAAAVSRAK